jgi:cytochrome c oxidase cbb3-type subunit 3
MNTMRTEKTLSSRTLLLALVALSAIPAVAQATSPAPMQAAEPVSMTVNYFLVAVAVIQAIFIMSMSSIMRTMGAPGTSWTRRRGARALVLLPLAFATMQVNAQAYEGDGGTISSTALFWWLVVTNVLLLAVLLVQLILMKGITRALTGEDELVQEEPLPTGPSWEERVLQRLTRRAPAEKEQDLLMHHEYDGIRELDNVLPPWWLWLFYGTVAWSVIYLINVHVINVVPHQAEEYQQEIVEAQAQVDAFNARQSGQVDENTVTLITDEATLAGGQNNYRTYCATCHGQGGEGIAGPNLTDPYWLHGGDVKSIFTVIKYGVAGKAMKAWKEDFKPLEMQALAGYVLSLQGTSPPNPKAPEGDLFKAAPADSTAAPASGAGTPADSAKVAVR